MIAKHGSISRARLAAVALITLGIVLRLISCLRRDGLVGDELMLTLNLADRDYGALLRPLDYAQTAPIPFLWAERFAIQIVGVHAWVVRTVPFVAGCLVLVVLWRVASQWLTEDEALLALGLASTSPFLIDYSAEVKPYSLDALLSLLVMASTSRLLRNITDRGAWAALAGLGIITIIASTPAPFVLAAVAAALALQLRGRSYPVLTLRMGATAMLWGDVFVAVYQLFYRHVAADPYMQQYWAAAMLSPGPRLTSRWLAGFEEILWPVSYWMLRLNLAAIVAAACIFGALSIRRRHGTSAAILLVGPLVALLAASALGGYPISMRLSIFLAPLLIIAAAAGIARGATWLHRVVPSIRVSLAEFSVLVPSVIVGIAWAVQVPGTPQGMPDIVREFERRRRPGEPVYVSHRVVDSWTFYSTDWYHPDGARLSWIAKMAAPDGPSFGNAPPRGPRRVGDGDQLVYRYRGREELFGASSGVQGRAWLAMNSTDRPNWQGRPDSGWSDAEAARLRTKGGRIWMVALTEPPGEEPGELFEAIARVGGRIESRLDIRGTSLFSIRLGAGSRSAKSPGLP